MPPIDILSKRDVKKIVNELCKDWEIKSQRNTNAIIDRLRRKVIDIEKIIQNWNSKIETGLKNKKWNSQVNQMEVKQNGKNWRVR